MREYGFTVDNVFAHQGVEDDDMNVICLRGRVIANTLAWELVKESLEARCGGLERHQRRVAKVATLECNDSEWRTNREDKPTGRETRRSLDAGERTQTRIGLLYGGA
jgi:hypothetical protein